MVVKCLGVLYLVFADSSVTMMIEWIKIWRGSGRIRGVHGMDRCTYCR